jgi:hypothetical protein
MTSVNLLDNKIEPSDAQLSELMQDVLDDAMARAQVANKLLRDTMLTQLSDVQADHGPQP